MTDKLVLADIKDTIDKLQNDDSYNNIGKLNLAAWLGERAHFLVAEIEKLRRERADLLAALEALGTPYPDGQLCFCIEAMIQDKPLPRIRKHSPQCKQARAALARRAGQRERDNGTF